MAAGRFEVSLRVSTLKRNFVSPRGYLMSPIYSETEFLIIDTERQLSKVSVDKIKIGQAEVSPASSVRNLGTWFDSHLDMSTHVTKTCASAFYYPAH